MGYRAAPPLPPRQQTDGWASRGAAGPQLRCGGNDAAWAASGGAAKLQRLRRAARAVRSGRGGLGVHRGRVSRHGRCLRVGGLPAYSSDEAGEFTRPAAAVAYRGTSGRERGGLGGQVGVLQAYSSDEAGEFNSRRARSRATRPARGGLGVHRAVVARGARARRAGASAAGLLERRGPRVQRPRGPRAARSAVATGSACTAGAWHERPRGAGRCEGCRLARAMRTARPAAAAGSARWARRALYACFLVILKKRSGSPTKR